MSRGIRNNNPGNIETGPPWQGLMEPDGMTPEQAAETRFAVFQSPKWGIRAIARTLITYQDKRKIKTVKGMINRWAPPIENNTAAYIAAVESKVGAGVIDVHSYPVMNALVRAIVLHENGSQPYTDAQIDAGLVLAGITPPERALSKTGTVKGGQVAAAGAVVETASEAGLFDRLSDLMPTVSWIADIAAYAPWVALALIIIGGGYMLWRRYDDRRRGLR